MQCIVLSSRVLTSEPRGQLLLPLGWKPTFFHKPFVTQVDKVGSRPKAWKQGESASVPNSFPCESCSEDLWSQSWTQAAECLMVLLITWSCRQAIYHGTLHCKWGRQEPGVHTLYEKKRKTTPSVYELFLTCPEYFKRSSKWKKSPGWWRTGRYSRLVLSSSLTFVTLASFWTVPWSPLHNCWSRTNKIYLTSIAVGIKCVCSVVKWNLPGSSVHGILQARILEWTAIPFSKESNRWCLKSV